MMSGRSPKSIPDLPYELLHRIIHEAGLNSDDIRALRLVCRSLANGPAASFLFHTIALSRLQRDVDSFLNIAAAPHLASQVRVIVWHELISDILALDSKPNITDFPYSPSLEDSIQETLRQQVRSLRRLSRLEGSAYLQGLSEASQSTSMSREEGNAHTISDEPLPLMLLLKAMDSMLNIHTVISTPMPGLRTITRPTDTTSYPLTSQSLTSNFLSATLKPPTNRMNFGFFNFLLFAVAGRSADHQIRRLCFSDEDHITSFGPQNLFLDHLHAFSHLTHLDFCISHVRTTGELFPLGQCIRSAENLQYLNLCFEKSSLNIITKSYALDVILTGRLRDNENWRLNPPHGAEFKWKGLRELHLSTCPFPAEVLGDFMRRQSHSLKKLHIHDCRLTARELLSIASANRSVGNLQLEEFTILQSEACDTDPLFEEPSDDESMSGSDDDSESVPSGALKSCYWVDEKQLVEFMNAAFGAGNDHPGHQLAAELAKVKNRFYVYTHTAKYDSETSHTAFVCETRLSHDATSQLYHPEEIHQADVENGDLRDSMGYSYQSGTHYNPVEDSSGLYGDQLMDDGEPEEEGDTHTIEASRYESFDYMTGSHGSDDDEFDDGWRWVLGRDFKGDIYFWRERQGDGEDRYPEALDTESPRGKFGQFTSRKYKTETWRFTYRNGEVAVGREPLEFWSDWKGAEAGDLAEPLPFGYTFLEFLNMTRDVSKQGPAFQCSAEYILARDGTRFKPDQNWLGPPPDPPALYDPGHSREENLVQDYVNRVDWTYIENHANWEWSAY
ncbi:hypothetical protein V8F20_011125 [Naviculisporaceae sp. PSN 640]